MGTVVRFSFHPKTGIPSIKNEVNRAFLVVGDFFQPIMHLPPKRKMTTFLKRAVLRSGIRWRAERGVVERTARHINEMKSYD